MDPVMGSARCWSVVLSKGQCIIIIIYYMYTVYTCTCIVYLQNISKLRHKCIIDIYNIFFNTL